MFIGGEWVEAQSGARLETRNPASGALLGTIPAGAAADVDRAVVAARAAFESAAWRDMTGAKRARLLWKIADLIEANLDELCELRLLIKVSRCGSANTQKFRAPSSNFGISPGAATKIEGTTIPTSIDYQPPGKKIFAYTVKEPLGVVGGESCRGIRRWS
jgi:phenylacetaldehyde dehydrogenase